MSSTGRRVRTGILQRFLSGLRFPQVFALLAGLFLLDLLLPDPIPFLDEMILAVLTVLLAGWKARQDDIPLYKPPEKNVTPPDGRPRD